jgi:hypothetical protein
MSLKNSNDTIRNCTRDLPVCSVVPYPLCHCTPLQWLWYNFWFMSSLKVKLSHVISFVDMYLPTHTQGWPGERSWYSDSLWTGWMVLGSKPCRGDIFHNHLYWPWAPPRLLYMVLGLSLTTIGTWHCSPLCDFMAGFNKYPGSVPVVRCHQDICRVIYPTVYYISTHIPL